MDYKVGTIISTSLLMVIVQASTSENYCTKFADLSRPCGCTISKDLFEPVCGSDGNTYLNTCFLDCQQILEDTDLKVEYPGICTKDANCICGSSYKPVCANNGETYTNECVLQCIIKKNSTITLKHRGVCVDVARQREQTRLSWKKYKPRMYRWGGAYQRKYQPMRHRGQQRNNAKKNNQALKSSENNEKHNESLPGPCYCSAMHRPVCGNNRHTFANACVLHCKAKTDPTLKFAQWGPCGKKNLISRNKKEPKKRFKDETLRIRHFRKGNL